VTEYGGQLTGQPNLRVSLQRRTRIWSDSLTWGNRRCLATKTVALVTQCVWASLLTLPRTVTTDAASAVAYGNVYTPAIPILGGLYHQYVRVLGFG
jgi:hypothetical protein